MPPKKVVAASTASNLNHLTERQMMKMINQGIDPFASVETKTDAKVLQPKPIKRGRKQKNDIDESEVEDEDEPVVSKKPRGRTRGTTKEDACESSNKNATKKRTARRKQYSSSENEEEEEDEEEQDDEEEEEEEEKGIEKEEADDENIEAESAPTRNTRRVAIKPPPPSKNTEAMSKRTLSSEDAMVVVAASDEPPMLVEAVPLQPIRRTGSIIKRAISNKTFEEMGSSSIIISSNVGNVGSNSNSNVPNTGFENATNPLKKENPCPPPPPLPPPSRSSSSSKLSTVGAALPPPPPLPPRSVPSPHSPRDNVVTKDPVKTQFPRPLNKIDKRAAPVKYHEGFELPVDPRWKEDLLRRIQIEVGMDTRAYSNTPDWQSDDALVRWGSFRRQDCVESMSSSSSRQNGNQKSAKSRSGEESPSVGAQVGPFAVVDRYGQVVPDPDWRFYCAEMGSSMPGISLTAGDEVAPNGEGVRSFQWWGMRPEPLLLQEIERLKQQKRLQSENLRREGEEKLRKDKAALELAEREERKRVREAEDRARHKQREMEKEEQARQAALRREQEKLSRGAGSFGPSKAYNNADTFNKAGGRNRFHNSADTSMDPRVHPEFQDGSSRGEGGQRSFSSHTRGNQPSREEDAHREKDRNRDREREYGNRERDSRDRERDRDDRYGDRGPVREREWNRDRDRDRVLSNRDDEWDRGGREGRSRNPYSELGDDSRERDRRHSDGYRNNNLDRYVPTGASTGSRQQGFRSRSRDRRDCSRDRHRDDRRCEGEDYHRHNRHDRHDANMGGDMGQRGDRGHGGGKQKR